MDQLSGLDATFLYLETENAPMHIGGVSILDPAKPDGGRFGLDDLRALMASRLRTSRVFRQRLAEVPLDLGRPYWIEDEDLDLAVHVERTRLPEPGGFHELEALAAWEFAQHLDRSRPLWQLLFVEGVDTVDGVPPGSVAIISRVHHAAIDGVSGSEILSALFDVEPRAAADLPETSETTAVGEPEPGRPELLRRAVGGLGDVGRSGVQAVKSVVTGLVKSGAAWGLKRVHPPPFPFTAPRTRFNAQITGRRVWTGSFLDLARVKAVKERAGCTVNDVVLAVCSGALRRYLLDKDELPEKPLVAMVPISVRAQEQKGTMGNPPFVPLRGNQVSSMLVSLATDVEEPAERLRGIRESVGQSKLYHQALGAGTLMDYSEVVPFGLAGLGAKLYTRMNLAERHRPIFNLVITNVPGPRVPLFVGEARLLRHVGAAPIFDGMGLILPVFSYAGTLSIGALSCGRMMPDIGILASYLESALGELES